MKLLNAGPVKKVQSALR